MTSPAGSPLRDSTPNRIADGMRAGLDEPAGRHKLADLGLDPTRRPLPGDRILDIAVEAAAGRLQQTELA